MPSWSALASAPSPADWLGAWGQIGGAAATVLAVLAAFGIAARDRRNILGTTSPAAAQRW